MKKPPPDFSGGGFRRTVDTARAAAPRRERNGPWKTNVPRPGENVKPRRAKSPPRSGSRLLRSSTAQRLGLDARRDNGDSGGGLHAPGISLG